MPKNPKKIKKPPPSENSNTSQKESDNLPSVIAKPDSLSTNSEIDPEASKRQIYHLDVAGGIACNSQMNQVKTIFNSTPITIEDSILYLRDTIDKLRARDPIEEMFITQMVLAHNRVLRLTGIASIQTEIHNIKVTNEYADKASNTYIKLVLALQEYRQPKKSSSSFNQTNIAGQQIVMNKAEQKPENGTLPPQDKPAEITSSPQACLQLESTRPTIIEMPHPASETVDQEHRPSNGSRKSQSKDELDETR